MTSTSDGPGRGPRDAPKAAAVWVAAVLSLVLVCWSPSPARAAEPETAPPTTELADLEAPTTSTAETGIGDLEGGSNTPSPRGVPEPPRSQRVADSAIAVGLLVVLAGGVIVAIWTARRGSRRGAADVVGPSQRER